VMDRRSTDSCLEQTVTGRVGKVVLVGAGPGHPGLITVDGLEALRRADAVVYDRLTASELLDEAPVGAERVYVGKTAGCHPYPQSEISKLLVSLARAGKTVVRLKGGDPYVFGRGSEEAATLAAGGIPFRVIPGVPAACGAGAFSGIPLTERGRSAAVTFVTAHRASDARSGAVDWAALARSNATLVVYMGVGTVEETVAALIDGGRAPNTPAAIIENATLPDQRTVAGTLETIAAATRDASVQPPALLIVGDVARTRERLAWYDALPLRGCRVIVTRPAGAARALVEKLRYLGSDAVGVPVTRIERLPLSNVEEETFRELVVYDYLVLTSAHGVRILFEHLGALGLDARALHGVRIAVIGTATARALAAHGVRADIVPEEFVGEALAAAVRADAKELRGKRVLLARAADARPALLRELDMAGAEVKELHLYRSVPVADSAGPLASALAERPAAVTFTSPSTVEAFFRLLTSTGSLEVCRENMHPISIGPITSAALRKQGIEPAMEALPYNAAGLLSAITEWWDARKTGRAPSAVS